jgi:SM-20-related protein
MAVYSDESWLSWIDRLSMDDYCVVDHFLPPALLQEVLLFFNERLQKDEISRAGIGPLSSHLIKTDIRSDYNFWLEEERDIPLKELFELVRECRQKLNEYCFLSLSGQEFQLSFYPNGGHYDKHVDQFKERKNRLISMVIYLNETWEKGLGGELKIYKEDGETELIEPLAGRCVLFKSGVVEHEVLTTRTDRLSISGWFLYQPPELGFFLGK